MPRQSERIEEFFPAASVEALEGGNYRIQFITHGLTRDRRRYYPKQVLEAAAKAGVFDGAKMYLNHSDSASDARRGHRDLRDWGATIVPGSVQVVEGNVQATCHAHLPEARSILDDPIAKASVGLSHDSFVKLDRKRIDGKDVQVVESIESCNSVDFVPTGNANGRVLEAAPAEGAEDMDLNDLTAEQLREARPDLYEAITKPAPQTVVPPIDVTARVTEAVAAATSELQTRLAAAEQALVVRETERTVAAVVDASDLSPEGRARVREMFAGLALPAEGLVERVQEKVAAEAAYMAAILKAAGVAPRITNQGAAGSTPEQIREGYDTAFRAKLQEQGYSAAEIDALMKAR